MAAFVAIFALNVPFPAIVAAAALHHLHEGNLARYGLRLSEFKAWQHTRR